MRGCLQALRRGRCALPDSLERLVGRESGRVPVLGIRGGVGTAGGLSEDLPCRSVVIANGACTDSALQTQRFDFMHYAPVASFELLDTAYHKAKDLGIDAKVGLCTSSDRFYDEKESWKLWKKYGVLAVEMEAAELYTLAAEFKRQALAILTISDNLVTYEETTAEERQKTFTKMIQLALETAIA